MFGERLIRTLVWAIRDFELPRSEVASVRNWRDGILRLRLVVYRLSIKYSAHNFEESPSLEGLLRHALDQN